MRCARKAASAQSAATGARAIRIKLGRSQSHCVAAIPAAKSHAAWKSGMALTALAARLEGLTEVEISACIAVDERKFVHRRFREEVFGAILQPAAAPSPRIETALAARWLHRFECRHSGIRRRCFALWAIRVSGAAQFDHRFDMERLREEIGKREVLHRVTCSEQHTQVACQGGGIAGNINQ
jgi:hypothetical protein